MNTILIRIPASHRKRDRFIGLLGRKPEFLYSIQVHRTLHLRLRRGIRHGEASGDAGAG